MHSPNQKILSLLANALQAHRSGDLKLASTKYKELLTLQPDNPDANHNLAVILSKTDRITEAKELFRNALRSSQVVGQFWLSYIDCLIKLDEYEEALSILKESFSKGFRNNKFQRLRTTVSKELTKKSNYNFKTAQELKALIRDHEDKLAFESAANLCKIAIQKYPNDYLFLAKFSLLANKLGNTDLEFEILTHLLKYAPNEKSYSNYLGNCWQTSQILQAFDLFKTTNQSKIPNYFERARDFFLIGAYVEDYKITKLKIMENIFLEDYQKELILFYINKGKKIGEIHFNRSVDLLPNLETKIQSKAKHLIALKHFGRSGTGLFHSLIDNHKSVSTVPSYFLSMYFDPQQWKELNNGPLKKLPERFVERYKIMFDPNITDHSFRKDQKKLMFRETEGLNTLGERKNLAFKINIASFKKHLQSELKNKSDISQSDFFQLIHSAYDKSIGETKPKENLFYHIHNPTDAALAGYAKAYSGSKLLIMVREPIQALESWIRNDILSNTYDEIVAKICTMIYDFYSPVFRRFDTRCIRLEDLKKEPKTVLTEFCSWAGLGFEESLLEMTIGGEKWWGDPTSPDFSTTGKEPFDPTPVQRPLGTVLSLKDRETFSELFTPFSNLLNYKIPKKYSQTSKATNASNQLDDLLGFEKQIADNIGLTEQQFKTLGTFKYFRIRLKTHMENLKDPNFKNNIIKPLILIN